MSWPAFLLVLACLLVGGACLIKAQQQANDASRARLVQVSIESGWAR